MITPSRNKVVKGIGISKLPQNIAKQRNIRIVICIDEFQNLAEFPDGKITMEKLRSIWQTQNEVSYCLYGSKRHLMSSLFSDTSQPFYRFGENIFLKKISIDEWVKFLEDNFEKTGKHISRAVAVDLVNLVESHSYFVQYLARICWNNSQQAVNAKILEASFQELLNDHHALFQNQTRNLTKYQINYLRALVAGEKQLTSKRVLDNYSLGSQGNIKRIVSTMEDMEILDYSSPEPEFCDPYFRPLFVKYFI